MEDEMQKWRAVSSFSFIFIRAFPVLTVLLLSFTVATLVYDATFHLLSGSILFRLLFSSLLSALLYVSSTIVVSSSKRLIILPLYLLVMVQCTFFAYVSVYSQISGELAGENFDKSVNSLLDGNTTAIYSIAISASIVLLTPVSILLHRIAIDSHKKGDAPASRSIKSRTASSVIRIFVLFLEIFLVVICVLTAALWVIDPDGDYEPKLTLFTAILALLEILKNNLSNKAS